MNTLTEPVLHREQRALVCTDMVVFTINAGTLQLLLRRGASTGPNWSLPGGYVEIEEDLDQCAARTLSSQTSLREVYLEQLYTFGRASRSHHGQVVTVAYYALVPLDRLPKVEHTGTAWFPWTELPALSQEQLEIARLGHQRLVAKLDYSTIAFEFMPEHFTLSELQKVYEIIQGVPLDKRKFRKRILGLKYLEATDKQRRDGSHRPARLYRYRSCGEVQYIK